MNSRLALALALICQGTALAQYSISTLVTSGPIVTFDGNGVAVDPAGNLYAAGSDSGRTFAAVLQVTPAPPVRVVGTNSAADPFPGCNNPATHVQLNVPGGLAMDSAGTIYLAQNGPLLSVIAGTVHCFVNTQAFPAATGVVGDGAGNAYFSTGPASFVYKATAAGAVSPVAGNGAIGCTGSQIGRPYGLALDAIGNLYIADQFCNVIWKVSPAGTRTIAAGIPSNGPDGSCPQNQEGASAANANLGGPFGVTVDAGGNLFIADSTCNRIRMVKNGIMTTIAGPPITAALSGPHSITVGAGGKIFVGESIGDILQLTPAGMSFYPVPPCRVVDTRTPDGTFGGPILPAGGTRAFPIPSGGCGIPAGAQAYSVNITAVPPGALTYLTAWPAGQGQPLASTLNSLNGAIVANAAIVPAGYAATGGAIDIYVSDASHVVIDVNGYFAPQSISGLAFFPVDPCRVTDTRRGIGPFGGPALAAGETRNIAVPSSLCNIPATAEAYALNITAVPPGPLQYLTAWPTGQTQPFVSTLNALQGQIVANAAIVPAGSLATGAISIYVTDPTNVIVDVNGYFAPPGAASSGPGPLYFYPVTPCRVADTRGPTGTFGGPPLGAGTTRDFDIPLSSCNIPNAAQAFSLNMTAVPLGPLFYLSAWPSGRPQPVVSTLNDLQGQIVANAAIVPSGGNPIGPGGISVFVSDLTNLVIDINGYFGQ